MAELHQGAMLTDFVMLRQDAFSADLCEELVDLFETAPALHTRASGTDGQPLFGMMDLTAVSGGKDERCTRLHTGAIAGLDETVQLYRDSIAFDTLQPAETMGWEHLRIKRYRPDTGEQFPMHVDVQDLATSKRALAFFCYLNDVEEGGETNFPVLDLSIKPQRGAILVFPPLWLYPHSANPVVSGAKYLCHSYLHYA